MACFVRVNTTTLISDGGIYIMASSYEESNNDVIALQPRKVLQGKGCWVYH